MATGNTHKKIGEDRTCSSEDMIVDRKNIHTHTDRHAHHNTPLPNKNNDAVKTHRSRLCGTLQLRSIDADWNVARCRAEFLIQTSVRSYPHVIR